MSGLPSDDIKSLKGVGPKRAELLKKLGITVIGDALRFFPHKYIDRRVVRKISELEAGSAAVARVTVRKVDERKSRRTGIGICTCEAEDGTGTLLALWFNRRGLKELLKIGETVVLYGLPSFRDGIAEFINPEFAVIKTKSDMVDFLGIVPVYPSTAGLPPRWFGRLMTKILSDSLPLIQEYLPESVIEKRKLLGIREALLGMHRPGSEEHWKNSRKRLAYEEFLFLRAAMAQRKTRIRIAPSPVKIKPDGERYSKFLVSLPFDLTVSQKKALANIFADTQKEHPMSRLLQGDVGTGKTVVALGLAAAAADAGVQTAIMAPTEILADQIYSGAEKFLSAAGIRCGLLKGGQGGPTKTRLLEEIKRGEIDVVVGTHALLGKATEFFRLGAVIIDEQQRFGVAQRGEMLNTGEIPHFLMMSATPIPRTVSALLFGDLDISLLRESPSGKRKKETRLIDYGRMGDLLQFVINESTAGGRTYWICPRVEDADDLVSVEKRYVFLKKHIGTLGIGKIHGKMDGLGKNLELEKFRSGRTKVLVGTTVLEVGVDVPEASVVVIESPERYGLSQLHQIRGRVGRGARRGVCILLTGSSDEDVSGRLKVILDTDDGFKIAEADLLIRGPGTIAGFKQHGTAGLNVADILRDRELLIMAAEDAEDLMKKNTGTPLPDEFMSRVKAVFKDIPDCFPFV